MKLLIAFSVLIGIFVEQCDLSDIDVGDAADQVVVTNTSAAGSTLAIVAFNHNEVSVKVPAGSSKTVSGLAATKYTVKVLPPSGDAFRIAYDQELQLARDDLVALTLDPAAPPDKVLDAAAQLPLIVQALQQIGDEHLQTCSAKIKTGVDGQVTIQAQKTVNGTWLWVVDCS